MLATQMDAARRIAVVIPCFNEAPTIGAVVRQFQAELPDARIYVFDNNSTDDSADAAMHAGAEVLRERRQGKGYVVQSMFREVDADVYVMVDGDGTYSAASVHRLLAPLLRGDADMVVGSRLHAASQSDFRPLNRLGNRLFLLVINSVFRVHLSDLLSGFRAFTRQFVKGLPLSGGGFEIETELTIKGLQRGYRIAEVPIDLVARPAGSHSKIRRFRDGTVILHTIFALFRDYKPLTFFGSAGLALIAIGVITSADAVWEESASGTKLNVARAAIGIGCVAAGFLSGFAGLILHTVLRRFQEFEHHFRTVSHELQMSRFDPRGLDTHAEQRHGRD